MTRKHQHLNGINKWWLRYEYKHTTLAILLIVLFVLLIDSALLVVVFRFLGELGYLGGFFAGLLSVSFFTAVPAFVLLVEQSAYLDPLQLAFVAALGSTIGDWLLLRFYEERVFHELRPLMKRLGLVRAVKALNRRATRWILLAFGAIVISTPLPDEAGLGLMGITHYKRIFLTAICFVLNFVGIVTLVLAARAIAG